MFMSRVKNDLFLLIRKNRELKGAGLKKICLNLINIRIEEASTYEHNKELIKELNVFKKRVSTEIGGMKSYVMNSMKFDKQLREANL